MGSLRGSSRGLSKVGCQRRPPLDDPSFDNLLTTPLGGDSIAAPRTSIPGFPASNCGRWPKFRPNPVTDHKFRYGNGTPRSDLDETWPRDSRPPWPFIISRRTGSASGYEGHGRSVCRASRTTRATRPMCGRAPAWPQSLRYGWMLARARTMRSARAQMHERNDKDRRANSCTPQFSTRRVGVRRSLVRDARYTQLPPGLCDVRGRIGGLVAPPWCTSKWSSKIDHSSQLLSSTRPVSQNTHFGCAGLISARTSRLEADLGARGGQSGQSEVRPLPGLLSAACAPHRGRLRSRAPRQLALRRASALAGARRAILAPVRAALTNLSLQAMAFIPLVVAPPLAAHTRPFGAPPWVSALHTHTLLLKRSAPTYPSLACRLPKWTEISRNRANVGRSRSEFVRARLADSVPPRIT